MTLTLSSQTLFKNSYVNGQTIVNSYRFGQNLEQTCQVGTIDSLQGCWLFSGNYLDGSGNANDGTNGGTVIGDSLDRFGNINSCIYLDGSSYVNINPVINDIVTDPKGSWSFWVKPHDATPASIQMLVSFGISNAAYFLDTRLNTDGTLGAIFYSAGTGGGSNYWQLKTTSSVFSDYTWTHVVIVQNGTAPLVYINGRLEAVTFVLEFDKTAWFPDANTPNTARIGDRNTNSTGEFTYFTGLMDDVRIYNGVITSSEASELHAEGNYP